MLVDNYFSPNIFLTTEVNNDMDEIIRVDKEVRDLFFYDEDANGIPDFNNDSGSVGGSALIMQLNFIIGLRVRFILYQ